MKITIIIILFQLAPGFARHVSTCVGHIQVGLILKYRKVFNICGSVHHAL